MGLGLVLGLLFDAAIIGIIIAVMEKSEFPGWGPMLGCVLAIGITTGVVSSLLPGPLSLLGIPAGAVVGAFVISFLCDMSLKRSTIAAGIYLGIRLILGLLLSAIMAA